MESVIDMVTRLARARSRAGFSNPRPDTPLGAEGLGLDSIDVLELVLELERQTGIRLRDESMMAGDLDTPASLAAYISRLRRN